MPSMNFDLDAALDSGAKGFEDKYGSPKKKDD